MNDVKKIGKSLYLINGIERSVLSGIFRTKKNFGWGVTETTHRDKGLFSDSKYNNDPFLSLEEAEKYILKYPVKPNIRYLPDNVTVLPTNINLNFTKKPSGRIDVSFNITNGDKDQKIYLGNKMNLKNEDYLKGFTLAVELYNENDLIFNGGNAQI